MHDIDDFEQGSEAALSARQSSKPPDSHTNSHPRRRKQSCGKFSPTNVASGLFCDSSSWETKVHGHHLIDRQISLQQQRGDSQTTARNLNQRSRFLIVGLIRSLSWLLISWRLGSTLLLCLIVFGWFGMVWPLFCLRLDSWRLKKQHVRYCLSVSLLDPNSGRCRRRCPTSSSVSPALHQPPKCQASPNVGVFGTTRILAVNHAPPLASKRGVAAPTKKI